MTFYKVYVGIMDGENGTSTKRIKFELRVYMHCNACERSVRRTIESIDGVEKVELDRDENKATVTGDFEPDKVVKKIKKKTGKKAEILVQEEVEEDEADEEECVGVHHAYAPPYYDLVSPDGGEYVTHEFQRPTQWDLHYFDDENTEACRVM